MGSGNIGVFAAGVVVVAAIYGMLALSLNLKFGATGLIDLGVVGYFAVGAYAFVLTTAPHPDGFASYKIGLGQPLWVGFIVAPLAAGLVSLIVGLPALRLEGEYLAIATLAFAEVLRAVAENEPWLTNGTRGFTSLHQPFRDSFSSAGGYQYAFMAAVVALLVLLYFLLVRLHGGPFGRVIRSVRENEQVAISVGKNPTVFRIKTFVVGGMVTGLAAAVYVTYTGLVVPSMFIAGVTFTVWTALVIGGSGNYLGVMLGAAVLITAQEFTRFLQVSSDLASKLAASRFIAMGLLLVLMLRFLPKGILPERNQIDPDLTSTERATRLKKAAADEGGVSCSK